MTDGYTVIVAPEVLVEVATIVSWWRRNRTASPGLFTRELDRALVQLSERPEVGRRLRTRELGDARALVLLRSGYRLFYQVRADTREVRVVHVRHSRRAPPR